MILELQNENDAAQKGKQNQRQQQHQQQISNATTSGTSSTPPASTSATLKAKFIPDLQKRFEEVSE